MELTVIATSVAVSIGLGLLGAHLMMSMVFSLMANSVARIERNHPAGSSADTHRRPR
jgi:hypothetical protein